MKIFSRIDADPELSDWGIQVPLLKSRSLLIADYLKTIKGGDVVEELEINLLDKKDLMEVHAETFINDLYSENSRVDARLIECYELINTDGSFNRYDRSKQKRKFVELFECQLKEASATYAAALYAIGNEQDVFYLGGGMHHAMSFGGRGFCLLNDLVIASQKLKDEKKVENIWIIDVDAHKGDGTAELTKDDSTISTLSIHMKKGWPLDSNESGPWDIGSNIDIEIGEGEEEYYIEKLAEGLDKLKNEYSRPELIFIVNGADPYEFDELKSASLMKMSKKDLLERDNLIYDFCVKEKVSQVWVMGGGYGPKSWEIYAQFLESIIKWFRGVDIFSWGESNFLMNIRPGLIPFPCKYRRIFPLDQKNDFPQLPRALILPSKD